MTKLTFDGTSSPRQHWNDMKFHLQITYNCETYYSRSQQLSCVLKQLCQKLRKFSDCFEQGLFLNFLLFRTSLDILTRIVTKWVLCYKWVVYSKSLLISRISLEFWRVWDKQNGLTMWGCKSLNFLLGKYQPHVYFCLRFKSFTFGWECGFFLLVVYVLVRCDRSPPGWLLIDVYETTLKLKIFYKMVKMKLAQKETFEGLN